MRERPDCNTTHFCKDNRRSSTHPCYLPVNHYLTLESAVARSVYELQWYSLTLSYDSSSPTPLLQCWYRRRPLIRCAQRCHAVNCMATVLLAETLSTLAYAVAGPGSAGPSWLLCRECSSSSRFRSSARVVSSLATTPLLHRMRRKRHLILWLAMAAPLSSLLSGILQTLDFALALLGLARLVHVDIIGSLRLR